MELDDPGERYEEKAIPGPAYEYLSYFIVCECNGEAEILYHHQLLNFRVIREEHKYIR